MSNKKSVYVSLFSCAGIGCYGFKKAGWECLATCELKESYLDIQRANHKCAQEKRYICGDLSKTETKQALYKVVNEGLDHLELPSVDVVIATPPCQGISLANHKKNQKDFARNSLVVDAINIIKTISPKVFLIENVSRFLKTACLYKGKARSIEEAINQHLSDEYDIFSKVVNLKDFGSQSSRTRTIVIGLKHEYLEQTDTKKEEKKTPVNAEALFPAPQAADPLWKVIGHLPSLKVMGETWEKNIWHSFRPYKEKMRAWIETLQPGQNAFDNKDPMRRPHQIIDGKYVENAQKNSDKYKRVLPNQVAPCIHTRNDILASQNTVHPYDDRVFSIAELMCMLTVPDTFRWSLLSDRELRSLSTRESKTLERKVRTVLGECVPTAFVYNFAVHLESFSTLSLNSQLSSDLLTIQSKPLTSEKNNKRFLVSVKYQGYDILNTTDQIISMFQKYIESGKEIIAWTFQINMQIDLEQMHFITWINKVIDLQKFIIKPISSSDRSLLLIIARSCEISPLDLKTNDDDSHDHHLILDKLTQKIHERTQSKQSNLQFQSLDEVQDYLKDSASLTLFDWRELSKYAENLNPNQTKHEAFFTPASVAYDCVSWFKPIAENYAATNRKCRILEPSVGTGNILEQVLFMCLEVQNLQVEIYLVDIDSNMLRFVRTRIEAMKLPKRFQIHYQNGDFLHTKLISTNTEDVQAEPYFDLLIGNPPFSKVSRTYKADLPFKAESDDLFALFWQRALTVAKYISLITPRSLIATPKYNTIRDLILKHKLIQMIDFGEKAFSVKIETINIVVAVNQIADHIQVTSWQNRGKLLRLKQSALLVKEFNGIVLFQDELFYRVLAKLRLGIFSAFRERVSTKSIEKKQGKYRLLGARDIGVLDVLDRGNKNVYVDDISRLQSKKFLNRSSEAGEVYLAPNGTYYPRVAKLPPNSVMTGGVAVLNPHDGRPLWDLQLEYLASKEFTHFFNRCWNFAQRSLNVDSHSVQFWGELIQVDKDLIDFFDRIIGSFSTTQIKGLAGKSLKIEELYIQVKKGTPSTSTEVLDLFSPHQQVLSVLGFDQSLAFESTLFDELWNKLCEGGVFALEQLLICLKKAQPKLQITLDFGPEIVSTETSKYKSQTMLFTLDSSCPARYLCYPENYITGPQTEQNLIEKAISQLNEIQQNCYDKQGRDFSLHRYVELLNWIGLPKPTHLSFSATRDLILNHLKNN